MVLIIAFCQKRRWGSGAHCGLETCIWFDSFILFPEGPDIRAARNVHVAIGEGYRVSQ